MGSVDTNVSKGENFKIFLNFFWQCLKTIHLKPLKKPNSSENNNSTKQHQNFSASYNKGLAPITHNTHVRNVKKIENSSIDLLRGQNSRSKSCKFHCFINFADEKRLPKHRQIASTGILDAKIFSGRPPEPP